MPEKPNNPNDNSIFPHGPYDPSELKFGAERAEAALERLEAEGRISPHDSGEPDREAYSPYTDPELLEKAGDDSALLNRLVAVRILELRLLAGGPDEKLEQTLDIMRKELKDYQERNK